MGICTMV